MDSDRSSGGHHTDIIPRLGRMDAPHLHWRRRRQGAADDEREEILRAAQDELDAIRSTSADPAKVESRPARDRRIVAEGEGWSERDVATRFRCGIRDVWAARRAAGRDEELGLAPSTAAARRTPTSAAPAPSSSPSAA
jgi:hypothetical protein